jgi:hypothetical protein
MPPSTHTPGPGPRRERVLTGSSVGPVVQRSDPYEHPEEYAPTDHPGLGRDQSLGDRECKYRHPDCCDRCSRDCPVGSPVLADSAVAPTAGCRNRKPTDCTECEARPPGLRTIPGTGRVRQRQANHERGQQANKYQARDPRTPHPHGCPRLKAMESALKGIVHGLPGSYSSRSPKPRNLLTGFATT